MSPHHSWWRGPRSPSPLCAERGPKHQGMCGLLGLRCTRRWVWGDACSPHIGATNAQRSPRDWDAAAGLVLSLGVVARGSRCSPASPAVDVPCPIPTCPFLWHRQEGGTSGEAGDGLMCPSQGPAAAPLCSVPLGCERPSWGNGAAPPNPARGTWEPLGRRAPPGSGDLSAPQPSAPMGAGQGWGRGSSTSPAEAGAASLPRAACAAAGSCDGEEAGADAKPRVAPGLGFGTCPQLLRRGHLRMLLRAGQTHPRQPAAGSIHAALE